MKKIPNFSSISLKLSLLGQKNTGTWAVVVIWALVKNIYLFICKLFDLELTIWRNLLAGTLFVDRSILVFLRRPITSELHPHTVIRMLLQSQNLHLLSVLHFPEKTN